MTLIVATFFPSYKARAADGDALVDELDENADDVEHSDVAVSHESGCSLSISRDRERRR